LGKGSLLFLEVFLLLIFSFYFFTFCLSFDSCAFSLASSFLAFCFILLSVFFEVVGFFLAAAAAAVAAVAASYSFFSLIFLFWWFSVAWLAVFAATVRRRLFLDSIAAFVFFAVASAALRALIAQSCSFLSSISLFFSAFAASSFFFSASYLSFSSFFFFFSSFLKFTIFLLLIGDLLRFLFLHFLNFFGISLILLLNLLLCFNCFPGVENLTFSGLLCLLLFGCFLLFLCSNLLLLKGTCFFFCLDFRGSCLLFSLLLLFGFVSFFPSLDFLISLLESYFSSGFRLALCGLGSVLGVFTVFLICDGGSSSCFVCGFFSFLKCCSSLCSGRLLNLILLYCFDSLLLFLGGGFFLCYDILFLILCTSSLLLNLVKVGFSFFDRLASVLNICLPTGSCSFSSLHLLSLNTTFAFSPEL